MGERVTKTRGDKIEISATVDNVTGPENGKCFFTVKRNVTDADADALFRKTSAEGEGVAFESPNVFVVTLDHGEQIDKILDDDLDTELPFDFRYRTPDGDPYTLRKGVFIFTPEITRDPTV